MTISSVSFVKNIRAVVARAVEVPFKGRTVRVAYDKEAYAHYGYLYCMSCKVAALSKFRARHTARCPSKRDLSQIVHVFGQFGGGAIFGNETSKIREYVKRVVKTEDTE